MTPGWYPDPAGGPKMRWWDGWQWTAQLTETPGKRSNRRAWMILGIAAAALFVVIGITAALAPDKGSDPAGRWYADDGSGIAYAVRMDRDGTMRWACVHEDPSAVVCVGADHAVDVASGTTSYLNIISKLTDDITLVLRHDDSWSCDTSEGLLVTYVCSRDL